MEQYKEELLKLSFVRITDDKEFVLKSHFLMVLHS